MSDLRYSVQQLLSSLSCEIRTLKCEKAKARYYFLRHVAFSKRSISQACESQGKNRDYFYSWAKRLLVAGHLESLKDESKKPKSYPNQTPQNIEKRIKKMRKKEPYIGPERISFYLKEKHKIDCPPSTVHRVLCRLGLIVKTYNLKKKSKHTKRYRRPFPGYLQMDIKYVPERIEDKQFYQISVVDHCSSWRYIEILERRREEDVIGFLNRMVDVVPFMIMQLQTDNATEFTDKFSSGKGRAPSGFHALDRWCGLRDIEHKLIPVGEKEINGKVENTHKFDEKEFYQIYSFESLAELRAGIVWNNERWNSRRNTKALNWRTPDQVIEDSFLKAAVYLLWLDPKFFERKADQYETRMHGLGSVTVKKVNKPKRLTDFEKYMQFLNWDKNQNWAFSMLGFSRSYSPLQFFDRTPLCKKSLPVFY